MYFIALLGPGKEWITTGGSMVWYFFKISFISRKASIPLVKQNWLLKATSSLGSGSDGTLSITNCLHCAVILNFPLHIISVDFLTYRHMHIILLKFQSRPDDWKIKTNLSRASEEGWKISSCYTVTYSRTWIWSGIYTQSTKGDNFY